MLGKFECAICGHEFEGPFELSGIEGGEEVCALCKSENQEEVILDE